MREQTRTFRWAAWLGWQLESNWAEPWLFAVYVIFKPLAGSLLLVCMYYAARAATQGAVPAEFLPYLYVGNACYMLVGAITFGMSWAVISDREHYRMLKYVYISPARFQAYFMGRGLSGGVQALLGAVLNVAVGVAAFAEVRHAILGHPVAWGWLLIYLVLGLVLLEALGLILTAAVLNLTKQAMFLSEGIAGILYLLCGVVFPLSVLPVWVQWVSLCLPPTYWIEGMRRTLLGDPPEAGMLHSPLASWGHAELALALTASTAAMVVLGQMFFRWSERRAWKMGRIEETTGA